MTIGLSRKCDPTLRRVAFKSWCVTSETPHRATTFAKHHKANPTLRGESAARDLNMDRQGSRAAFLPYHTW